MARRGPQVEWKEPEQGQIPDVLALGVALVVDLARRGVLSEIAQRVRIRRQGGFCGFDVLLYLLYCFAAVPLLGIKTFWVTARPCKRELAVAANRDKLASPSSVSRALNAVEPELLRPASEWLLSEGAGIDTEAPDRPAS